MGNHAISPGRLGKQAGILLVTALALISCIGCAGGNLTTRENGAGIGALGFGAGALIGDQRQGQKFRQADQQRRIDANQAENHTTKA